MNHEEGRKIQEEGKPVVTEYYKKIPLNWKEKKKTLSSWRGWRVMSITKRKWRRSRNRYLLEYKWCKKKEEEEESKARLGRKDLSMQTSQSILPSFDNICSWDREFLRINIGHLTYWKIFHSCLFNGKIRTVQGLLLELVTLSQEDLIRCQDAQEVPWRWWPIFEKNKQQFVTNPDLPFYIIIVFRVLLKKKEKF